MLDATAASTRLSTASVGSGMGVPVLSEAGYRFFTFMILRPWLLAHKRGALVPEADTGTDSRGVRHLLTDAGV